LRAKISMFNCFKNFKKDTRERVILNLVDVYTDSPGCRYESEMPFSGERFRKELLRPAISDAILNHKVLVVNMDGAFGYSCAFLEEAFGGLIRVEGETFKKIRPHLEIISKEEPYLIEEIMKYMKEANND